MTSWPDAVNGLLELTGALMLAMNVAAVRRDKQIKGIHWSPTVFFTSWSVWNLYFYPSLDQWLSFVGSLCMAVVNATWLVHVWWYWRSGRTTVSHAPVPQEPADGRLGTEGQVAEDRVSNPAVG